MQRLLRVHLFGFSSVLSVCVCVQVTVHYNLGVLYLRKSETLQADTIFRDILKKFPQYVDCTCALAARPLPAVLLLPPIPLRIPHLALICGSLYSVCACHMFMQYVHVMCVSVRLFASGLHGVVAGSCARCSQALHRCARTHARSCRCQLHARGRQVRRKRGKEKAPGCSRVLDGEKGGQECGVAAFGLCLCARAVVVLDFCMD